MRSVWDAYENAVAESFFATLERELPEDPPQLHIQGSRAGWDEPARI
jgi:hypothetical protein